MGPAGLPLGTQTVALPAVHHPRDPGTHRAACRAAPDRPIPVADLTLTGLTRLTDRDPHTNPAEPARSPDLEPAPTSTTPGHLVSANQENRSRAAPRTTAQPTAR